MSLHLLKLRIRRFWRRRMLRLQNGLQSTEQTFERFGLARLSHLRDSWRFLVVWLGLAALLIGVMVSQIVALRPYYQKLRPIPGGRYTEGVLGSFTTANPLYAVSDVDTSVARLVFAGLLKYDHDGHLVGDLAESWSSDATGSVYTVKLRPDLRWQDGVPLTAADVVYTYQAIQDPDVQSPLYGSWRGIAVKALDSRTVRFTLPNPLSSFAPSLTNGIVPKHILQSIDPVDLRSASFNTANPVGAGPFKWSTIGVDGIGDTAVAQISLVPYAHYWAGKPKLSTFSVYAYADSQAMVRAYRNQEITAMVGLSEVPQQIAGDKQSHVYNLPLLAGVYVFFRNDAPILNDPKVRQAMVLAVSRSEVLDVLDYSAIAVDEPLLKGQFAYDSRYAQVTNNTRRAAALLKSDGWSQAADNTWVKKGHTLAFQLVINDNAEYRRVADALHKAWLAFGVDVSIAPETPADFQATLAGRSKDLGYDAALYGISIGSDPDVFVYWDSSQADPRSTTRLNFSDYQSVTADLALEAGRTRLNQTLRILKYRAFLQAWQADAPALGLYQPRLLYISHDVVYGLGTTGLSTDADRFSNVQNWMVNTGWEDL